LGEFELSRLALGLKPLMFHKDPSSISSKVITDWYYQGWMRNIAKGVTNPDTGFLRGKNILLLVRDTKFVASFHQKMKDAGIKPIKTPPRSPNCNTHIERFFRSIKSECLHRMIFFGGALLLAVINKYLDHYHDHRNYQGIKNLRITPPPSEPMEGKIICDQQLGGILKYYHRQAA